MGTDTTPTSILQEFDNYQTKKFSFNDASFDQFKQDIFKYWNWCSHSTKELGFVACQIMGICINTASVERLWFSMGHLYSASRC
ncbi:23178_t:CDS:2 [Dentiscutata erythropus]|uniref:23178_t:CDS:1 n=1 Tax=Dentiscutata erythropus TaxID=1348616 RepID=A0A9N9NHW9_9GLOM|nr:23178_t:CDS:2 [Dentiscutata erythropus]